MESVLSRGIFQKIYKEFPSNHLILLEKNAAGFIDSGCFTVHYNSSRALVGNRSNSIDTPPRTVSATGSVSFNS